ncbi:MAG: hypothetical protein HYZ57_19120 [Acidobacteria bacterium]|nr:hypothetical protein [Acidobacteriota bacterium]MBI3281942.1 hypothetical protein [Acidobacteriota bacterium]
MPRTDLHIKVTVDHEPEETAEKLAAEIIRTVEKIYGVRGAELSNYITHPE